MGEKSEHILTAVVVIITVLSLHSSQAYSLKEKKTEMQLYFHDNLTGKNVNAAVVASGPSTNKSGTLFGQVRVIDCPLTERADPTSKLVGRAQGLFTFAGLEEITVLYAATLVFRAGEFNGSTLAVLGNNRPFTKVREMPIVGGSGKFRMARGYVLARTVSLDIDADNSIIHYNVTVYRY